MSISITAARPDEWQRHGLADFTRFADRISTCNVSQDGTSRYGEWFFVPDEPLPGGGRVVYFGSWDDDYAPGAPAYTHAEVFTGGDPDDLAEFTLRVRDWAGQPPFDAQP